MGSATNGPSRGCPGTSGLLLPYRISSPPQGLDSLLTPPRPLPVRRMTMRRMAAQVSTLALATACLAAAAAPAAAQAKGAANFSMGYTDIGPVVGVGGINGASASFGGRFEHAIKPLPDLGNG